MRIITQQEMINIRNKIEAPGYPAPSEWETNEAVISIHDDGRITITCNSVEDAERTLYAMMMVISAKTDNSQVII